MSMIPNFRLSSSPVVISAKNKTLAIFSVEFHFDEHTEAHITPPFLDQSRYIVIVMAVSDKSLSDRLITE